MEGVLDRLRLQKGFRGCCWGFVHFFNCCFITFFCLFVLFIPPSFLAFFFRSLLLYCLSFLFLFFYFIFACFVVSSLSRLVILILSFFLAPYMCVGAGFMPEKSTTKHSIRVCFL